MFSERILPPPPLLFRRETNASNATGALYGRCIRRTDRRYTILYYTINININILLIQCCEGREGSRGMTPMRETYPSTTITICMLILDTSTVYFYLLWSAGTFRGAGEPPRRTCEDCHYDCPRKTRCDSVSKPS